MTDTSAIRLFLRNHHGLNLKDKDDRLVLAERIHQFMGAAQDRPQRTPGPLLTDGQRELMLDNGRTQKVAERCREPAIDFPPVAKLFTPGAGAIWLLTELHPQDPDVAYGLCDLGIGFPELGPVCVSDLLQPHGPWGLPPVERDEHFMATKSLRAYTIEAIKHGHIVA
jgi:hypothetical protein